MGRGRRKPVPVVIEGIETVDDPHPGIVHIAIGFSESPALTSLSETAQLGEERPAVPMMGGEGRVTHLVQEHATLRPLSESALNENLPPLGLEKTVAAIPAGQTGGAPHRAWGDAAIEQVGVQLLEQPLDGDPSSLMWHSWGSNAAAPRFEHAIFRWPSAFRPNTSSFAG